VQCNRTQEISLSIESTKFNNFKIWGKILQRKECIDAQIYFHEAMEQGSRIVAYCCNHQVDLGVKFGQRYVRKSS
jgi:hypothetical protein